MTDEEKDLDQQPEQTDAASDSENPEGEGAEQKLSRRERRAQAAGKGEEEVKDRNQRLRAEAAAKRRKDRAAERAQAASEGLDAGELVDDALTRGADATGKFVRSNFVWLQWILLAGAATGIAIPTMRYVKNQNAEKQGHVVASVLANELGRVATAEPTEQRDARLVDTRKEFESVQKLDEAALKAWGSLEKSSAPELQLLGLLGEANSQYDLQKYADARKGYEAVLKHPHAKTHTMLSGRAQEGIGLSWEAEQKYEEAIKAFEKLESSSLLSMKQLGQFHKARILHLTGKSDEAKEILSKLNTKLSEKSGEDGPTDYLGAAVRDLLRTVDPMFAISERQEMERKQQEEQAKQLQKMIEEMQKKAGASGGMQFPGMPEAPEAPEAPSEEAPAPEAPAPEAPAPAPAQPAPVQPAPAPAPAQPAAPSPAPAGENP